MKTKPFPNLVTLIKDTLGVLAILSSATIGIYEYGKSSQIKKESTENYIKQARHADSLAILTCENQKTMLFEIRTNNNILKGQDSIQINKILKLEKSIQELGRKILPKDEFYNLMEPYISEKKKCEYNRYHLTQNTKDNGE